MPEKTIHIKTEDADYVILLEQNNRMAEEEGISREYIPGIGRTQSDAHGGGGNRRGIC